MLEEIRWGLERLSEAQREEAALCEQVCRRPTERFSEELGVPVSLTPEEGSLACTWRWGGVPDVRWPSTPAAR